jgi:hypothetical protein
MTTFTHVVLAALTFGASASAQAHLEFGNVAPGSGTVELRVDGARAASLDYLDFGKLHHSNGPLVVEAITESGDTLAQASFRLVPESGVKPMLLLVGNGEERPYELRLFQHGYAEEGRPWIADVGNGALVAVHHLAPVPPPEHDPARPWTVQTHCEGNTPGGGGFDGGGVYGEDDWYFGTMRGMVWSAQHAFNQCTLAINRVGIGTLELAAPFSQSSTLRMMLVGDGRSENFQIVAVENGVLVGAGAVAEPKPIAVTRSQDIWYDINRPAQAVTLYETPDGQGLLGFWFTHDTLGRPTWFHLDGGPIGYPGQWELTLYRMHAQATPIEEVGRARLFYLDCNNADLRVLSGDREHTLRLRRSMQVTSCASFD